MRGGNDEDLDPRGRRRLLTGSSEGDLKEDEDDEKEEEEERKVVKAVDALPVARVLRLAGEVDGRGRGGLSSWRRWKGNNLLRACIVFLVVCECL